MSTKNVFKGSVGVVADKATVGSVVVGNAGTVDVNLDKRKQLALRLDDLHQKVVSEPSTTALVEDVKYIEQAKDQVSAGDETGAWQTMKKLSAWTVGVARDIGVDIAAAVIRQQTGLP